jgi:hypothetical protein
MKLLSPIAVFVSFAVFSMLLPVSSGASFRGRETAEFKEIEVVEDSPRTGTQKLDKPPARGGLRVTVKQTNSKHHLTVNTNSKNMILCS